MRYNCLNDVIGCRTDARWMVSVEVHVYLKTKVDVDGFTRSRIQVFLLRAQGAEGPHREYNDC